MRRIFFLVLIVAIALFAQTTEFVRIQVGRSVSIPITEGEQVRGMRECDVVNFRTQAGAIVLSGVRPGTCMLELPISRRFINVTVYAAPSEVSLQELQLLLPETYDQALNMVEIGGRLVITGRLDNPLDVIKYYEFLKFHEADAMIVDLVEHQTPTIAIEVKIYEVSKASNKNYDPLSGLSARLNFAYQTGTEPDETQLAVTAAADLLSILEFLVAKGDAKVIARPVLTVLHGDSASYHVGGEVPYIVATGMSVQVDFKPYGLMISIRPRLLASGMTQLDISAEFSKIDRSVAVQNIPGFLTRRINSTMLLRDGETSILAGLNYKDIQKTKTYIPVLGWLMPFLFFKYDSSVEDREIYIAVTPTTDPNRVYNLNAYPKIRDQIIPELKK